MIEILVPVERGTPNVSYGQEGKLELPDASRMSRGELVQIIAQMESAAKQFNSAEMSQATLLFKSFLSKLQSEEPVGNFECFFAVFARRPNPRAWLAVFSHFEI